MIDTPERRSLVNFARAIAGRRRVRSNAACLSGTFDVNARSKESITGYRVATFLPLFLSVNRCSTVRSDRESRHLRRRWAER